MIYFISSFSLRSCPLSFLLLPLSLSLSQLLPLISPPPPSLSHFIYTLNSTICIPITISAAEPSFFQRWYSDGAVDSMQVCQFLSPSHLSLFYPPLCLLTCHSSSFCFCPLSFFLSLSFSYTFSSPLLSLSLASLFPLIEFPFSSLQPSLQNVKVIR